MSYDALGPATQTVLCQISVFPASFDVEAAREVVVANAEAVDLLELLRRRSLLEWEPDTRRYNLHDLVREFAAARLEDAEAVRLHYARHYTKVAAQAQFGLYLKGNTLSGLALFDLERIHIDAGWTWSITYAGNPVVDALILNYSDALNMLAELRYDARRERIPHLEAQRGAAQRLGRRAQEGYALNHLGHVYNSLGETRQAIAFSEQALVIHREIGDRRSEGLALMHLGNAYIILGETRQVIAFYEPALVIQREIGDRGVEGLVLMNLGNAYNILGETLQAIDFCEQALVIHRQDGDRRIEGLILNTLGNVYRSLGDAHQAIAFYEQALVIHREIGNQRGEAVTRWNLGRALERKGDLARSAELMQVLVDYYREIGHPNAEKRAAYVDHLRQRLAASQNPLPADTPDEE
ncbi:MAG: tetratricopeptide repeat protein [Roseiflexaceae bacterium]